MRGILISLLLLAGTARAQSIFPAGGEVPSEPTIWISAAQIPAITVRANGSPVMFEIDEMNVVGGVHRIAVRPSSYIGSEFTVTAGSTTAKFTVVDSEAHGDAARYNEVEFHVERISMANDALVVDAIAKRGTIIYLLDQNRPDASGIDSKYTWVGGGTERSSAPVELPGGSPFPATRRRFVIPLAWFGASCASTKTIEFSTYVQQMSGGATLHPIARMQVDRGKVRMPFELVGKFEPSDELEKRAWLPCATASVDGGPIAEATLKEEPVREPIKDEPAPYCPHTGEPWVKFEPTNDQTKVPETTDDTVAYFQVLVVLFGALAVMWRATSKIDA